MLRDRLIDGLQSLGVEYDAGLEDIFGEKAPVAQVAMRKLPGQNHTLDFVEDFYPFLEEESRRTKDPQKAVDFVQLSYVIYTGFRKEFPEDRITPNTTFQELGVKPDECERNLFVQVIVKNNGFEDGLTGDEYLRMLRRDVRYTILKFAKFNDLF